MRQQENCSQTDENGSSKQTAETLMSGFEL